MQIAPGIHSMSRDKPRKRRFTGGTLLRRGDLSVTDVCFEVGCSSLGTFSSRFTELVGVPPSVYQRQIAEMMAKGTYATGRPSHR